MSDAPIAPREAAASPVLEQLVAERDALLSEVATLREERDVLAERVAAFERDEDILRRSIAALTEME
jgi:cell division septum initiation protein DivIVA